MGGRQKLHGLPLSRCACDSKTFAFQKLRQRLYYRVIIFNKRKPDTNITFEDRETGAEAVATLEDVCAQDFNLSVSAYIQTEDKRESVDIHALNAEIDAIVARENVLRGEIQNIIAEIEGV